MNTDMLRNSIQNVQLVLGYNRLKFWWSCCHQLESVSPDFPFLPTTALWCWWCLKRCYKF